MNIKNAIQELRSQKDDPNSPGFFLYKLLETAHPTMIEFMEYQAAAALIAGKNMGESLGKAASTEAGRKKIQEILSSRNKSRDHKKDISSEDLDA